MQRYWHSSGVEASSWDRMFSSSNGQTPSSKSSHVVGAPVVTTASVVENPVVTSSVVKPVVASVVISVVISGVVLVPVTTVVPKQES